VRRGPAWVAAVVVALALSAAPAAPSDAPCGAVSQRPWCDTSLSADTRAGLLLARLTLDEKVSLLAGDELNGVYGLPGTHTGTSDGIARVGIPTIHFTDGMAGIRQGSATAMPAPIAVAASFDPAAARLDGATLADEAKRKGNEVFYGPMLTIARTPLGGRTFQGVGEDPLLAGATGVAFIRGMQAEGVIANANIYVANNQEGAGPLANESFPGQMVGPTPTRGSRFTVNAIVGERTLREIYLPPFEAAVKDGDVGTVMCAYNRVNWRFNCENRPLLTDVLKGEWGFRGFVLSDYGAAHSTLADNEGGLDFEPWPGAAYAVELVDMALERGGMSTADLDDHVRRYLRTLFAFGAFDRAPYTDDEATIDKGAHAAASQQIAERGMVLLKNAGGVLPLAGVRTLAVIGAPAAQFVTGGGSSVVTPYSSVTPLDGIGERAKAAGVAVRYDDGSDPAKAAALARASTVAIVVAADYQTEGIDRACLSLECPPAYGEQDALVEAVASANRRTVVVLETGGPVLTPWRDRVAAILEAWYPGQQGGAAIARVLFGDVDPGGALPATFPRVQKDLPTAGDPSSYPGVEDVETYKEGVLVGYRWFDAQHLTPAFPFGFGLSYTRFALSGLSVGRPNGDGGVPVSFTVRNTGGRAGSRVAQVYVGAGPSPPVKEPPLRLAGFQRVDLAAGGSARVNLVLPLRARQYWDVKTRRWRTLPGCLTVGVGVSSRDVRLRGRVC
jgi:beta-glucosidase